jgi:hypothetical protein
MYTIKITEANEGRSLAVLETPPISVTSANAEHDICHRMTEAGLQDGPVTFERDGIPTLRHRSVHTMGKYRIALGDEFPQLVRRRTFVLSMEGSPQAGDQGPDDE